MGHSPEKASVTISPGHCCYRQLTWECRFQPATASLVVVELLLERGFVDESQSPLVRELVHPEEHRIVVIPATGRVQLRLHYLTPQSERKAVAEDFAGLLTELFN